MGDSGNIDPRAKAVNSENKFLYKQSSSSQEKLAKNNSAETPIEKEKDFDLRHSNPILAQQLQNLPKSHAPKLKHKKTPPNPSIKVQRSVKGLPINPRKVKPNVPGRLKAFFDEKLKQLDKLSRLLEIDINQDDESELLSPQKIKQIDFAQIVTKIKSASIAELLAFEIYEMDLDYQMVSEVLLEKVSQFNDDKQLQDYLRVLISEINNQNPYAFNFLIYLFLPLPLPYKFAVKDFEFEKEQEEILEDHRKFLDQKSDHKDQDKNQQDQDDEQEKQTDSELFLSVKTINFNKLHFVIKYFANIKTLKVAIKAAPAATEIAIPIESNLEDDLEEEEGKIAFDLSLWNNAILHNTDERILKLEQRGKVNKYILKACVSILKTIYENDYNYNEEEDLL